MPDSIASLLKWGTEELQLAGIEGAPRDARLLLAAAAGLAPDRLSLELRALAAPVVVDMFTGYLDRRARHEPVSRILGRRLFWGREFAINGDVLDPRPETETLIAAALDGAPARRLLDLGTGSGIIAQTLLAEWPRARAVATDISPDALALARENAIRLLVTHRLDQVLSDWWQAVEGSFDLIVSNPPYITAQEMTELAPEVALFDPAGALSPGGDGLEPYRIIAAGAPDRLEPGGRLLVEIGWKQGPDVAALCTAAGLERVQILPDLDGRDRVVSAWKGA